MNESGRLAAEECSVGLYDGTVLSADLEGYDAISLYGQNFFADISEAGSSLRVAAPPIPILRFCVLPALKTVRFLTPAAHLNCRQRSGLPILARLRTGRSVLRSRRWRMKRMYCRDCSTRELSQNPLMRILLPFIIWNLPASAEYCRCLFRRLFRLSDSDGGAGQQRQRRGALI